MIVIAIVMVVATTAIVLNYRQIDTDHVKTVLSGTVLQAMRNDPGTMRPNVGEAPIDIAGGEEQMAPMIGYDEAGMREQKPLPVVVFSDDGANIRSDRQASTAMIDEDTAYEAVRLIRGFEDGYGTVDELGLDYYRMTSPDGQVWISLTDSSYSRDWINKMNGLIVGVIGTLIVLLVLVILLSKWIVKPVETAWAGQKRFIADASHDLQAPLTVILANMSILLQSPDATINEERQWVENTQKEASHMQGLVSELLELSCLENAEDNGVRQYDEVVDVGEMVERECLAFDAVALETGYIFEYGIEDGVFVDGNAAQLAKMIRTLLDNAFKYARSRVEVNMERAGRFVEIEIANDGDGISDEDIEHVFERFYRADKARTPGGGHGLGLPIAKQVAVNHGGDITCESGPARTVFTVKLPTSRKKD